MKQPSILPRFAISTLDSSSAETANPRLAATIYAFDVPLKPENPWSTSAGDGIFGTRVVWHFYQPDAAGNSPGGIAKHWLDDAWMKANGTNPLAICKRAFEEFDRLKAAIESGRGFSFFGGPSVVITNTRKAAVIAALGHPILGWRRNPSVTTWCFHQASAADAALYDDPRLYERLPDAPISYARAAILGHEAMVKAIKDIQFARVEHKGRTALIGRDISKDKLDALEKILYRK